jgi:hypothetical protein
MTASQMNAQFQAANNEGVTSSSVRWVGPGSIEWREVSPGYYATLTFRRSEWCSTSGPASGCATYNMGGYEEQIPLFIQD